MNDYFLYAAVIATFVFAYMWYDEKKKHFTTKVELDIIKSRSRLGVVDGNLEQNRAAYKAARDKFHAELHPIPDYMLEHVSKPSSIPPGFERPIEPGATTNDSLDTGLRSGSPVRPATDNTKQ